MKKNRLRKGAKVIPGSRKQKSSPPRTAEEYFAKPRRFQDLWDRVVSVISKMRAEKTSLQQASREIGISPRSVTKWAGSAIRKTVNGRYTAKASDRLLRILKVPTAPGTQDVGIRGSRQATLLGEYWNALRHYLQTGDASRLETFRGKQIKDADGLQIKLLTDREALNRLGSAGVLSFESLYARSL